MGNHGPQFNGLVFLHVECRHQVSLKSWTHYKILCLPRLRFPSVFVLKNRFLRFEEPTYSYIIYSPLFTMCSWTLVSVQSKRLKGIFGSSHFHILVVNFWTFCNLSFVSIFSKTSLGLISEPNFRSKDWVWSPFRYTLIYKLL